MNWDDAENALQEHCIGEHFERDSGELEPKKDACWNIDYGHT